MIEVAPLLDYLLLLALARLLRGTSRCSWLGLLELLVELRIEHSVRLCIVKCR